MLPPGNSEQNRNIHHNELIGHAGAAVLPCWGKSGNHFVALPGKSGTAWGYRLVRLSRSSPTGQAMAGAGCLKWRDYCISGLR